MTTKFDINDEVWVICDHIPTKGKIKGITCDEDGTECKVLLPVPDHTRWYKEGVIGKTKDELKEILFGK